MTGLCFSAAPLLPPTSLCVFTRCGRGFIQSSLSEFREFSLSARLTARFVCIIDLIKREREKTDVTVERSATVHDATEHEARSSSGPTGFNVDHHPEYVWLLFVVSIVYVLASSTCTRYMTFILILVLCTYIVYLLLW